MEMKESFTQKDSEFDHCVPHPSVRKLSLDANIYDIQSKFNSDVASCTKIKDNIKAIKKDRSIDNDKISASDREKITIEKMKNLSIDNDKNTLSLDHNRMNEKVAKTGDIENSEIDDKTPTNDMSISSINEMTDNSLLKDSLEGSAKLLLDTEGVKMDIVDEQEKELSSAKDEKDVDTSERDHSASGGVWLTKSVDNTSGILMSTVFLLLLYF